MGPMQVAGEDDTGYLERGKEPPYPLIKRLARGKVLPSLRVDGSKER